jgi:hypothetical protein
MLPKFRSVQDTKGDEERQCFSGESLNSQARHDKTQVLAVKLDRHEDATSDDEIPIGLLKCRETTTASPNFSNASIGIELTVKIVDRHCDL